MNLRLDVGSREVANVEEEDALLVTRITASAGNRNGTGVDARVVVDANHANVEVSLVRMDNSPLGIIESAAPAGRAVVVRDGVQDDDAAVVSSGAAGV